LKRRLQIVTELLLPDFPLLQVEKTLLGAQRLLLIVKSTVPLAQCPLCNFSSSRVHSRYTRSLTDLPWSDLTIQLLLQVRRFFCLNLKCRRVTFAERLGEAVATYARRTNRLSEKLYQIGLALGGEAGARLAKTLGLPISSDSLLRMVKKRPLRYCHWLWWIIALRLNEMVLEGLSFAKGYFKAY
jgi:transposase